LKKERVKTPARKNEETKVDQASRQPRHKRGEDADD